MPRYRAKPDVIETELPDELILLDPTSREMFTLNATGRVVWRALAAGGGRADAITRLTEAFAVDAASAGADVDALAAQLASAGLLDIEAGDDRPEASAEPGGRDAAP